MQKFYEFFMTVALAIPPFTCKQNRPVRLFGHVRLIGRIRYKCKGLFLSLYALILLFENYLRVKQIEHLEKC